MMPNTDSSEKNDIFEVYYATLTENLTRELTELEQKIQKETGEKVALIAYRF